jgi:ABC-type Zn uptake system ZnuABC Zn-binding protein ZnuA
MASLPKIPRWLSAGILVLFTFFMIIGCSSQPASEGDELTLPELQSADLADGEKLNVVATTNIIGDVVSQVGGDAIQLTTLLGAGQDPHSYVPAARDLTAVAGADVIFINGWDLEEGLVGDLKNIGDNALIVPISANIEPLPFGEDDHEDTAGSATEAHDHALDPHVWFSVRNVQQWVDNVELVLSTLDPTNASIYAANATAYRAELDDLAAYVKNQMESIPEEKRFLVTNHNAFGYLEADYGLTMLGTVIPGASTLAEPSASDLADLINTMKDHGLCAIFSETATSDTLAQTVAGELDYCDEVKVLPLYTGSLGPAGSGADSYIGMFRANVDTIVSGLK